MKKRTRVPLTGPEARNLIAMADAEIQYIIDKARATTQEKMLRLPQVKLKIGRAASTIWKDVKDRTLPPPIALGSRAVAWRESELQAWIEVKVLAARTGLTVDMPGFISQLTKPQSSHSIDMAEGGENG